MEREIGENNKPITKSFNLKAAKSGKPICTRDGRKAKIICFSIRNTRPIVAVISNPDGDDIRLYYSNGALSRCEDTDFDLMMLPEKKEGWINIYKEQYYKTKEEAMQNKCDDYVYIDTIKVEWEE